ncbi:MAG: tol-pal system protein YbgF [Gammaproteobacteria bacterium]
MGRLIPRGTLNTALAILLSTVVLLPVAAQSNSQTVETRVAKLERALNNRGLLDLLQTVERLQSEVQRLRGQIEEQNYTIDQLRKTQRDTYVDIDQRLQNLSGQSGGMRITDANGVPPLTTVMPGQAAAIAGTTPPSNLEMRETSGDGETLPRAVEQAVPTEPASTPDVAVDTPVTVVSRASIAPQGPTIDNEASETAYHDAFSLLKAGEYDESIAAFTDFLVQFPNSQYADNAQYWLGETYYVKREFEPALVEYRKLIDTYPESKKRSHAMLKIGYSYHELGQLDQARAVLEDLRNRYAGTTAARLAEERIHILVNAAAN